MYIKGIGTIRKEDAMKFLTKEGRDAVKSGEITPEELGAIYKLELVKRASTIGSCQDTFNVMAEYQRKSWTNFLLKKSQA